MISLYDQPQDQVDLYQKPTVPLSPEVISSRTEKANYALGDDSPGPVALESAFASGNDQNVRKYAANKDTLKRMAVKRQLLQEALIKTKKPLSNDDLNYFMGLSQKEVSNPDTALEEQFSKRLITQSQTTDPNQLEDASVDNPEVPMAQMDVAEYQSTKNQLLIKKIEDMQAEADRRSTGAKVSDFAESLLPFKWWWESQNAFDTKQTVSNLLPGSNWEENAAYAHLLSPEDFQKIVPPALDAISAHNPNTGLAFAHYLLSHGTSDTFLNNVLGIADVADVAGTVLGGIAKGAKIVSKANNIGRSLKDVLQASGELRIERQNVIASTGDLQSAGVIQGLKNLKARVQGSDTSYRGASLWNSVPSIVNPRSVVQRSVNLSGEASRRIEEGLIASSDLLQEALVNPAFGQRLTRVADLTAVEKTIERLSKDFASNSSAVINIKHSLDTGKNLGGINTVEVQLGKPDATLFSTKKQANAYAGRYGLPTGGYNVQPLGKKFFLTVTRDVNETNQDVLEHLSIDTENKPPESLISQFIGYLRTPEDLVSPLARANRHVVQHASQEFNRYASEVAKSVGKLPGKERDSLENFLNENRDWHTQVKDSKTGEAYTQFGRKLDTIADFESAYKEFTGEYPTERSASAFFKFKQLADFDYIIRNLSLYRDLSRQGVASHGLKLNGQNVEGLLGKEVDYLPKQSDSMEDAGVLWINQESGNTEHFWRNSKNQDELTVMNSAVIKDLGYKILQIANPAERPLKDHGIAEPVNFIIAKDFTQKPLDFQLIPYSRSIGHTQYSQEFFGKQAIVSKYGQEITGTNKTRLVHNYEGDRAVAVFTTEAEAKKYIPLIDQARILLRDKKILELRQFLRDKLPFYSRREFQRMFASSKNEAGDTVHAAFSLDEPFVVAFRNQSVFDALKGSANSLDRRYTNLNSLVDSPYNLMKGVSKEFAGPRDLDLKTLVEAPAGLRLDSAKKISSLEMMSKGIASATRERFFKDYQIQAVTSWIRQFQGALDLPLSELQKNPLHYLNNPPWDKSQGKTAIRKYAENNRRAILSFLGQQNDVDKVIHGAQHRLLSSIYTNLGQKASEAASGLAFTKIDNPIRYLRAAAFHLKLGVFNPTVLFTNSQTLFHSMAITGNPLRAASSLAGAFLMRSLRHNPTHLEYYAKKAGNLGWNPEEFKASFLAMRKSGWDNIEGEIAYLDDVIDPNLFQGTAGKFLNKGTMFFKGTERMVRMNAWNIAWQEFRSKSSGLIGDREIAQILTRADDLALNMTRASSTALQRGLFSIPLQFFSFQQRLMEQMLGKRLTRAEKTRVFLTYSALYGVPVATVASGGVTGALSGAIQGGVVSGGDVSETIQSAAKGSLGAFWPFYDDIRQEGLAKGWDMNSGVMEVLSEGIPAVAVEAMFGNEYNGGQRYGPSGLSILKDIAGGDKSLAEIFMGVSGSVGEDITRATQPVLQGFADAFSDKNDKYPLILKDFTDLVVNPVSSLSNTSKMIYALNTGIFMSKNGIEQQSGSTWDALLFGITGMSPRGLNDAFLMLGHEKDIREMQDSAKANIFKNMKLAARAASKEDRDIYLKKVHAEINAAGFTPDQYGQLFQQAFQAGGQTMVDSIKQEFYMKPTSADEQNRPQFYLDQQRQQGTQ